MNKTIIILGGTGFIGTSLTHKLSGLDYKVILISRNPKQHIQRFPDADIYSTLSDIPLGTIIEGIINLAGAGIADQRWSVKRKQTLYSSRVNLTQKMVAYIHQMQTKPKWLIQGSAAGYYGTEGNPVVDETSPTGTDFLGNLAHDWEEAAKPVESLGVRLCILRTTMVLAKNGGALAKIVPPFQAYLGGPFGNGQQWMSWIDLEDQIRLILHLITHSELSGPFNAAAPHAVTNTDFCQILGQVLHRPSWFPTPGFVLKILLGELSSLLLQGQNVKPRKTLESGFEFQYPKLQDSLKHIFDQLDSHKKK